MSSQPVDKDITPDGAADPAPFPSPPDAKTGPGATTEPGERAAAAALSANRHPVFYDERQRRGLWVMRAVLAALVVGCLGTALLVISLFAQNLMPATSLPKAHVIDTGNADPQLNQRQRRRAENADPQLNQRQARRPDSVRDNRRAPVTLQLNLRNLFHIPPSPLAPQLSFRQYRQLDYAQKRDKKSLQQLIDRDEEKRRLRRERAQAFLDVAAPRRILTGAQTPTADTITPAPVPKNPTPIVAGFYVNWEETSLASAHQNIRALTHFIPSWLSLRPAGANFSDTTLPPFVDMREPSDKGLTVFVRSHHVPIIPLINNYTKPKGEEESEGNWDTQAVHQIVSSPAARANLITHLLAWLMKEQMQGINIDFEDIASEDQANLVQFMKQLYAALHPHGLIVTQDVEVDNDSFDVKRLAQWNDWLVPMFYDEHTGGTHAGPVASIPWTEHALRSLLDLQVPPAKIVMGVGNFGYDWRVGSVLAEEKSYQSAIITAKESQPDAVIHLDRPSLNPTFSYSESVDYGNGKLKDETHVVWFQDALSVYDQLLFGKARGVRGAALWYLGSEDPSLWSFYNAQQWKSDWAKLVDGGSLNTISYRGAGLIDFEGEGELLKPLAAPETGQRTVTRDPKTGLLTAEAYARNPETGQPMLPSSYVVRRYGGTEGNVKKQIVLTFDDGPDPVNTPQILDILKQYHVKACFFVIGKSAEEYPDIVRRIWDEGHEIGNHSFSHPDMFKVSEERQRLELNSTQRIIQAITGHSTVLFRPPYGTDTEPRTGKEVSPLLRAAEMNYISVGEKNDPQDWRLFEYRPGTEVTDLDRPRNADEIVKSVVVNRDVGSIVLLHDGGGDRTLTIEALPQIIAQLQGMGYQFVNVAGLTGISEAKLMPPVTGSDALLVDSDRYVFEVAYLGQRTLTTLFILSVALGVSRILFLMVLAVPQWFRERRRVFPTGYAPSVSVVIAAYNEEKVIVRTVESLLASDYLGEMEIIVVDDGSRDNTYEVTRAAFALEPRVRVFRKENGGKASALDRGIAAARGEILVSLDADTLFAPTTISRLVRHFVNPRVGAVSGNVQVGNAHNILTRWQSLEYTTSQNFDRRAYDLLNCITVVPGAVGALRRSAVVAVGGYTSDTLAEDTDLTWKLRRAGWRIVNDSAAMAYTEAPETLQNLAKQRFRWTFGTLQCLWKHRAALAQHGAFGWIALPSLLLYQILFPAISPFMDIAMVWALFAHNFAQLGIYYLLMFGIEFVAATLATLMGRGNLRLLPWLFFQRFVYRQLMYYVVLKSIVAALHGGVVGWNKFERTGAARIEEKAA